jgi:hypothetical protein
MESMRTDRPPIAARLIEALIVVVVVSALITTAIGGVDLRKAGIPFRSGNPYRALVVVVALVLVYFACFRARATRRAISLDAHLRRGLVRLLSALDHWSGLIACAFALGTLVVGVKYGAFVAGGSDSYGYVSQAELWLSRDLIVEQPIARKVPWPAADRTFAPLGYTRSIAGGGIVPTYPPGLPVLMALGKLALGNCGPFFVVPFLGGLAVWLTYRLGTSIWSRRVGLAAAALLASSPAFVFMLLMPMSDVAATCAVAAALIGALARSPRRALWTGVAIASALCIRPNLAPLAAVLLAGLMVGAASWRARLGIALQFGAGVAPLLTGLALLNTHLYGAPWRSGYGEISGLYSWAFAGTNLWRYSQWLFRTETLLVAGCVLPLLAVRWLGPRQRLAVAIAAALVACVWMSYVWYRPFDVWWTLRFLLPAFPAMLVLATIGWRLALVWIRPAYRSAAVGAVVLTVLMAHVDVVRRLSVLSLKNGESDYLSMARYARQRLPENAVVISVLHSGSLRLYADRLTLRYDWVDGRWWRRMLRVLTRLGYRPYVVLTDAEETAFRERFRLSDARDAPGTLLAELRGHGATVRLYDPLREASAGTDGIPVVAPCLRSGCR